MREGFRFPSLHPLGSPYPSTNDQGSYELRYPILCFGLGAASQKLERCPNSSSLFPPLAAVVAVALDPLLEDCTGAKTAKKIIGLSGFLRSRFFLNAVLPPALFWGICPRQARTKYPGGRVTGRGSPLSQCLTALPAPPVGELARSA